jgi:serine/threonine-protein kinase SRPK3
MLRRLSEFAKEADHPGLDFTRLARDIFKIDGPYSRHCCIATKPQGSSLRTLQETFANAIFPKMLVKSLVHRLLFSVNWLHATCGVVHTGMLSGWFAKRLSSNYTADISPQNVLTAAGDEIIFKDIEDQESQDPSTPIMNDGVPVYRSRATMVELSGIPILTDFGQMRLAEPMNNDWWMPDSYRAPEVLLKLPWAFPVDVWSVGVMVSRKAKF